MKFSDKLKSTNIVLRVKVPGTFTLGSDRMGTGEKSPASTKEVIEQVTRLSEETGMSKVEIDNLIWSFCADGYGEICTATPHCEMCPIREWCNG